MDFGMLLIVTNTLMAVFIYVVVRLIGKTNAGRRHDTTGV